jgi:hypothetical protein
MPGIPTSYTVVFFMFNDLIVHFVDIGRIVDLHCLIFLVIIVFAKETEFIFLVIIVFSKETEFL